MTTRRFLSLANRHSASPAAEGFLHAHQEWLENCEIAKTVSPILVKVFSGDISPRYGLDAIRNAALDHLLHAQETKKDSQGDRRERDNSKPITAEILTKDGVIATSLVKGEEKDLVASFETPQSAERWVYRRLIDGEPDWTGKVIAHKVLLKGVPAETVISRDAAMSHLLRENSRSPYMHRNKVSVQAKPKMRVRNKIQQFSRG
jgi:hypothetical protein